MAFGNVPHRLNTDSRSDYRNCIVRVRLFLQESRQGDLSIRHVLQRDLLSSALVLTLNDGKLRTRCCR
jgi:hypothetical protein